MTIQYSPNKDDAAGLTDLSIQPRVPGLRAGRRVVCGDGVVREDGFMSCEVIYGYLRKDRSQVYVTILAELGLDSTPSRECTIRLPDNDHNGFTNYNAVITRPDVGADVEWDRQALLDVRFQVTRLKAL